MRKLIFPVFILSGLLNPLLVADESSRDVEVITLEECDRVAPTINPVALVEYIASPSSWPCDGSHYRSSCWSTKHFYKKEIKALVVKKRYCDASDCFKEVKMTKYLMLKFQGPEAERDKQKSIAYMQAGLNQYLAENAIRLCP